MDDKASGCQDRGHAGWVGFAEALAGMVYRRRASRIAGWNCLQIHPFSSIAYNFSVQLTFRPADHGDGASERQQNRQVVDGCGHQVLL